MFKASFKFLSVLALSALVFTITPSELRAQSSFDVKAELERMQSAAEQAGNSVTYEGADFDGSRATLKNLKIEFPNEQITLTSKQAIVDKARDGSGENGLISLALSTVQLTREAQKDDKSASDISFGVKAESLVADGLDWQGWAGGKSLSFSFTTLSMNDVAIKPGSEDDRSQLIFENITVDELNTHGGENLKLASTVFTGGTGLISTPPPAGHTKQIEFTYKFGPVTMQDFDLSNLSLFIGKLDLPGFDFELKRQNQAGDDVVNTGSLAASLIENFYVPIKQTELVLPEKKQVFNIGRLLVDQNEKPAWGWDSIQLENSYEPAKEHLEGIVNLNNIFIDTSSLDLTTDNPGSVFLKNNDLEKVIMNWNAHSEWALREGNFVINENKIEVKNILSINPTLAIVGLTKDLATQMQALSQQMNFEEDPNKKNVLGLQLVGLMSQLALHDAQLVLSNHLTSDQMTDLLQQNLGQTPEQAGAFVNLLLPGYLGAYNIPDFAQSVGLAVGTFIQGNRSIAVTAQPETNVPLPELGILAVGIKPGNDQAARLIERLNLKIEAR